MNINEVKNEVNKNIDTFINIRRKIHRNPELSMKEYETTDFIIETLREFGIEEVEKINSTGVVVLLEEKALNV